MLDFISIFVQGLASTILKIIKICGNEDDDTICDLTLGFIDISYSKKVMAILSVYD